MPTTYLSQYSSRTTTTSTKTKSISYGTSDQIFSAATTTSSTTPSGLLPNTITVLNDGLVPLTIIVGYMAYSAATASTVKRYLHTMLMPGETYYPSVRAIIETSGVTTQFDGTSVDNAAPDSNMYTDSGADVDDGAGADIVGSASSTKVFLEAWTSVANNAANLFRVGDLIRVNNEIMEVTGFGDLSDLANTYLTVIRGVHGSTAVDTHSDDATVRLPFFNAYHDFDKFSVAKTTEGGRFKANNFFGVGRATTGNQGIMPGSVAFKFYELGAYQTLGLSGLIAATKTGLVAGRAYTWKLSCDGGADVEMNVIIDGTNTSFGGTNGLVEKMQANLDEQFYTAGGLLEKRVRVNIVNGDLRFSSGQNLSTSAISLSEGYTGSYNLFAPAHGRIPAIADVSAAVPASLPKDVTYDNVTYATTPTSSFLYDDGFGTLKGNGSGTINYETGAIDFTSVANAEFVYSVSHTAAFSGKLNDITTNRVNSLIEILVNNPSQKRNGSVKLTTK